MTKQVALWNWRVDPVPDARVVVAAPGLNAKHGSARWDWAWDTMFAAKGHFFVVPYGDPRSFPRLMDPHIIAALHVQTQADLDGKVHEECGGCGTIQHPSKDTEAFSVDCPPCHGVGRIGGIHALLSVQASHRALVVSPKEAIDLNRALWDYGLCDCAEPDHPPLDRDALARMRASGLKIPHMVDLVIITGFDSPLRPDHVRPLVAECRAAGVPVVLLWGEWCPVNHMTSAANEYVSASYDAGDRVESGIMPDSSVFYRVGSARSGSMLDGEELLALPEWIAQ